jgi:hypothetical protein
VGDALLGENEDAVPYDFMWKVKRHKHRHSHDVLQIYIFVSLSKLHRLASDANMGLSSHNTMAFHCSYYQELGDSFIIVHIRLHHSAP